eukprot:7607877-Alexandrium_andersonii.AAC.1
MGAGTETTGDRMSAGIAAADRDDSQHHRRCPLSRSVTRAPDFPTPSPGHGNPKGLDAAGSRLLGKPA